MGGTLRKKSAQGEGDDPRGDGHRGPDPAAAVGLLEELGAEKRADHDADLAGRCDVAHGRDGQGGEHEHVGDWRKQRDGEGPALFVAPLGGDFGAAAERERREQRELGERGAGVVEERGHAEARDAVAVPEGVGGDEDAGHGAVGDGVAQVRAAPVKQLRAAGEKEDRRDDQAAAGDGEERRPFAEQGDGAEGKSLSRPLLTINSINKCVVLFNSVNTENNTLSFLSPLITGLANITCKSLLARMLAEICNMSFNKTSVSPRSAARLINDFA